MHIPLIHKWGQWYVSNFHEGWDYRLCHTCGPALVQFRKHVAGTKTYAQTKLPDRVRP